MADGSRAQREFHFPRRTLASALRPGEVVVDLFAGGGGASEALRQALGRDPDIAINHDEWAIGMHAANHPFTRHMREDIWHADPVREVGAAPVGWLHASPDCTHFSQAKGGQPRSRATRSLSWVVMKWAGTLARAGRAPRIISLENVEQILKWGPLVAKRCKATGRVLKLDGSVAARGERVPLGEQFLVPDPRHAGRTWRQFVSALRGLGYLVEWKKLTASDFGAGTSRTRLFMVARRDGEAIRWPAPTHGKAPGLQPFVTAADCIDWSIPCPSIFERKKPLADATLRRVAKGLKRYVLDAPNPFIIGADSAGDEHGDQGANRGRTCARRGSRRGRVDARSEVQPASGQSIPSDGLRAAPLHASAGALSLVAGRCGQRSEPGCGNAQDARNAVAPLVTEHANSTNARSWSAAEPLRTQCANVKGGHFALAAATLVQTGYGEREGQAPRALDLAQPLGTVVGGGGKHAVAAAHLVKFRGDSDGRPVGEPLPTITSGAGAARPAGAAHAMGVIAAYLEQANTGMVGHDAREPLSTVVGKGCTQRVVGADLVQLSPEHEASALRVAAFLVKYYGTAAGVDIAEPLDTVTTRDRLALVTVLVQGVPHVIVDIGLRMLKPHELYRAQGFPADYIIDRTADGRPLSVSRAVRMVGNSVSPPPLLAIARANLDDVTATAKAAA